MFKRLALLAIAGLALTVGTGCSNKTSAERDSVMQQNKSLADQLEAEKRARAEAEARAAAPQPGAEVANPSTPDMGVPEGTGTASAGRSTASTIEPGVTRSKNKKGQDTIEISGDVLFDSGKAALKPTSKKALDKIAAIIKKEYNGQQLEIGGHTDPNPVKKSGWDDNWDLGAARARAVLLYLESKGISGKHMHIASYAANEPKSTKNLALNRRVEIIVQK